MGIEIEPLPVYGDDCDNCTPALFSADETPKFVTVEFADIIACPGKSPPWGTYVLEQWPEYPCLWVLDKLPAYYVQWHIGGATALLRIHTYQDGPLEYVFIKYEALCAVHFTNQLTQEDCGPGYIAHSGTGDVTWV